MKILEFAKSKIKEIKAKNFEQKCAFLEVYFTRYYEQLSSGKIDIPAFMKAQTEVARLKERGLVDVTYKQITRGF